MNGNPISRFVAEKKLPTVSIGMPVYNGESFIREALDSLLAQTLTDFELIISDNSSTDETEAICREFEAKDERIRYVRQTENRGAVSNFQFVLDEAVGEYFMWAAADDAWDKYWIEVLLKSIRNTDIGVCGAIVETGKDLPVKIQEKDKIILDNFSERSHLRCFLADEGRGKCHYIYSLFDTKKVRKGNFYFLRVPTYWSDSVFVNNLLSFGDFRCIDQTYRIARDHDKNSGQTAWIKHYSWKRVIYLVHPWEYYQYHSELITNTNKVNFVGAVVYKHITGQLKIWTRAIKYIFCDRSHFLARIRELSRKRKNTSNS